MDIQDVSIDGLDAEVPVSFSQPDRSLYQNLIDLVSDGVYIVDRERRISFWNSTAERMTGYQSREVIGRRCADGILNHCNESGQILCGSGCPLAATMEDGRSRSVEAYFLHRDGRRVPVSVRSSAVRSDDGTIIGCAEIFSDLSKQNSLQQSLRAAHETARTDPLTGLANRRLIEEVVDSWGGKRRNFQEGNGVIFIDIDHFKSINDTWGHDAGDEALRKIGETITDVCRSFDTVGRWGGEEFVVLAPGVALSDAVVVAERLRAVVAEVRIPVDGDVIAPTISVGVTILREGERGADAVERADELMYRSKREGRNRVTAA